MSRRYVEDHTLGPRASQGSSKDAIIVLQADAAPPWASTLPVALDNTSEGAKTFGLPFRALLNNDGTERLELARARTAGDTGTPTAATNVAATFAADPYRYSQRGSRTSSRFLTALRQRDRSRCDLA